MMQPCLIHMYVISLVLRGGALETASCVPDGSGRCYWKRSIHASPRHPDTAAHRGTKEMMQTLSDPPACPLFGCACHLFGRAITSPKPFSAAKSSTCFTSRRASPPCASPQLSPGGSARGYWECLPHPGRGQWIKRSTLSRVAQRGAIGIGYSTRAEDSSLTHRALR